MHLSSLIALLTLTALGSTQGVKWDNHACPSPITTAEPQPSCPGTTTAEPQPQQPTPKLDPAKLKCKVRGTRPATRSTCQALEDFLLNAGGQVHTGWRTYECAFEHSNRDPKVWETGPKLDIGKSETCCVTWNKDLWNVPNDQRVTYEQLGWAVRFMRGACEERLGGADKESIGFEGVYVGKSKIDLCLSGDQGDVCF